MPVASTILRHEQQFRAGRGLDLGGEIVLLRHDQFQRDLVAHGQVQNPADPAEIARPFRARDLIDLLPHVIAELSLVPGLECQARQPKIGTGELFRRPQRLHARMAEPGALVVLGQRIDAEDVVDMVAHQTEGDRESRLPRSDHQHVEDRLAVRRAAGHYPRPLREIEQRAVLSRTLFQQTQPLRRVAQECGHNSICAARSRLTPLRVDQVRSTNAEREARNECTTPRNWSLPLPALGRGEGGGEVRTASS